MKEVLEGMAGEPEEAETEAGDSLGGETQGSLGGQGIEAGARDGE